MKIPSIFKTKKEPDNREGIHYIQPGSPHHPNNPLDAVPAKPFTFRMVDSDGRNINEAWIENKWSGHPNAGPFVADALDDMIVAAAARQAASIKGQMVDEDGHSNVVKSIRNLEPDYFHSIRNHMEQLLNDLTQVLARINQQR